MKSAKILLILVLALGLMVCWPTTASAADAMGTAFTYQGHLYDANHVANGTYDFQFKLYEYVGLPVNDYFQVGNDVNKPDVDVIDGYFTVELDGFMPFPYTVFNGDARWLEIGVRPGDQNDPCQYTILDPRQEITPTPYAFYTLDSGYASNASRLGGYYYTDFAWASHTHSGSDITSGTVDEGYIDADITRDIELDSGLATKADISHNHDGSDIVSGTIYYKRIDTAIARDSEIMSLVLAGDGSGSGLDADLLDGQDSADFAAVSHTHSGSSIVSGTVDEAYIDADITRDTELDSGLATKADTSHHHDGSYVNVTGDTMSGSTSGSLLSVFNNTGSGSGIYGQAAYGGVWGNATSTGYLVNYGGYFTAAGGYGRGVYGEASCPDDVTNYGGYFTAAGDYGRGVYGEASSPNDITNYGGYFTAAGKYGQGISGTASGLHGTGGGFYSSGLHGIGISAEGGANGYAAMFYGDVLITSGRVTTPVLEITGGSDLSERFEVRSKSEQVKPGMVVSIDAQNPGNLVVSTKAYDRRVAGIISGAGGVKPGMLMGQKGTEADGEHPVALTGRVYCRADASNGSIEPGDLLTTSDTPGHAMKVTDYTKAQGAILGKAMTPLAKDRGLVLVLVNLQ